MSDSDSDSGGGGRRQGGAAPAPVKRKSLFTQRRDDALKRQQEKQRDDRRRLAEIQQRQEKDRLALEADLAGRRSPSPRAPSPTDRRAVPRTSSATKLFGMGGRDSRSPSRSPPRGVGVDVGGAGVLTDGGRNSDGGGGGGGGRDSRSPSRSPTRGVGGGGRDSRSSSRSPSQIRPHSPTASPDHRDRGESLGSSAAFDGGRERRPSTAANRFRGSSNLTASGNFSLGHLQRHPTLPTPAVVANR